MIFLTTDLWEIRTTARKGQGLFALKDIPAGTVVGDYIGTVINTARDDFSQADQQYLLYYSDQASLLPADIRQPGIHLVNHSCNPNCWMYIYYGHTLFFTLRYIFSGEELTIAYLLNPRDECDSFCPHECLCGSNPCSKTMHLPRDRYEEWRLFSEAQAKQTRKATIRYGSPLPLLSAYPTSIPDHDIYRLTGCQGQPALRCDDITVPSSSQIRHRIRQTGRILFFPKAQTTIMGVENGRIILV